MIRKYSVADSGPGFRAAAWPKDTFTGWAGIYFCQFQTLLDVVYSLIKTFIAAIQLLIPCLGGLAEIFIYQHA
jgi:hypothetical protein